MPNDMVIIGDDPEPKYVAVITNSEWNIGYDGEHSTSDAVVGALTQNDAETYEDFRARVNAKIADLGKEIAYGDRKRYYGLNASIVRVFEE